MQRATQAAFCRRASTCPGSASKELVQTAAELAANLPFTYKTLQPVMGPAFFDMVKGIPFEELEASLRETRAMFESAAKKKSSSSSPNSKHSPEQRRSPLCQSFGVKPVQ